MVDSALAGNQTQASRVTSENFTLNHQCLTASAHVCLLNS